LLLFQTFFRIILLSFYFIYINYFRVRCSRKWKLHCFFICLFLLFLFYILRFIFFFKNWFFFFLFILLLLDQLNLKWIYISFLPFTFKRNLRSFWLSIGNSFIQIFPCFLVILWVFGSATSVRSAHCKHISKPPSYFLTYWNFILYY
jgi:hypothetical protein